MIFHACQIAAHVFPEISARSCQAGVMDELLDSFDHEALGCTGMRHEKASGGVVDHMGFTFQWLIVVHNG